MGPDANEIYSELKQVFLGGLEQPQTSWLLPVKEPFLEITGEGVTAEGNGFSLDFGEIPTIDSVQRSVSISNMTQQETMLWLKENPGCITARFTGDLSETILNSGRGEIGLNAMFYGNIFEEKTIHETLLIVAEMGNGSRKEFAISIHAQTVLDFPCAKYSFNFDKSGNTPVHDFGRFDPVDKKKRVKPYRFSIHNIGRDDLYVSFNTIPQWLHVDNEFEGQTVRFGGGKIIIEGGNEVVLYFSPNGSIDFLGEQVCELEMMTNDIRPWARNRKFRFIAVQEIIAPYVTPGISSWIEVAKGGKREFDIQLFNWGSRSARVIKKKKDFASMPGDKIIVPALNEGKPGKVEAVLLFDSMGMERGDHRLEIEFSIPGSKRSRLKIPVAASVIDIRSIPGEVDFGFVDPVAGGRLTVDFQATNGRKLAITAKPVQDLKEYLKVSTVNSNSLEIDFTPKNIKFEEYSGPGILVCDHEIGFQYELPVKFSIMNPGIELFPETITGEAFRGVKNEFSFEIRNNGKGKLNIDAIPGAETIHIIGSSQFIIEPGETATVQLLLDGERINESFFSSGVELLTNIPGNKTKRVNIDVEMKTLAGKLCSNCHRVSMLNMRYCSSCGTNILGAKLIMDEEAVVCPVCNRSYEPVIKFCPVDGNMLKKFKGGVK